MIPIIPKNYDMSKNCDISNISIAKPFLDDIAINEAVSVMRSGNLASGKKVEQLEEYLSEYLDYIPHVIACNNGTSALHTAIHCTFGRVPDGEVIVPALSFVATATAAVMAGFKVKFCDIDPYTYNMDPASLENCITNRTVGIIPVHLYGQICNMNEISSIASKYDIPIVEDAAQALGGKYQHQKAGTIGDAGCFSLYATKNIGVGEGGFIVTPDDDIADSARKFINHGQSEKYVHSELGYNYRMTDIVAAISKAMCRRIDEFNDARIENALHLSSFIDNEIISTPIIDMSNNPHKYNHIFHQYVIRLHGNDPGIRNHFMHYLRNNGIESAIHYPKPIHHQPIFKRRWGKFIETCPVSTRVCNEVLSLPIHPLVTLKQIDYIADVINRFDWN